MELPWKRLDLFEGKSPTAYASASQVGYELFGMKAYFFGDWKILGMPKTFGPGEWELFDLKQATTFPACKQGP